MTNNERTRQYLKDNGATLVRENIVFSDSIIDGKITLTHRKYYRKRNGKQCYVDVVSESIKADWGRIKTYKNTNNISANPDYSSYLVTTEATVLNKDYKAELKAWFIDRHNLKALREGIDKLNQI